MILVGGAGILAGIAFVLTVSWLRGEAPVVQTAAAASPAVGVPATKPASPVVAESAPAPTWTGQRKTTWASDGSRRSRSSCWPRTTYRSGCPGPARTRCPVSVARDTDVRRSRLLGQLRGRRLPSDGSPAVGRWRDDGRAVAGVGKRPGAVRAGRRRLRPPARAREPAALRLHAVQRAAGHGGVRGAGLRPARGAGCQHLRVAARPAPSALVRSKRASSVRSWDKGRGYTTNAHRASRRAAADADRR